MKLLSLCKNIFLPVIFLGTAFQSQAQSTVIHDLLFNSFDAIAKLDFTTCSPVLSYMSNTGYEAIAHAEDVNGNIIFYVISSGVYNSTGALMPGSGTMFTNPSAAEIDIGPFPQNPN